MSQVSIESNPLRLSQMSIATRSACETITSLRSDKAKNAMAWLDSISYDAFSADNMQNSNSPCKGAHSDCDIQDEQEEDDDDQGFAKQKAETAYTSVLGSALAALTTSAPRSKLKLKRRSSAARASSAKRRRTPPRVRRPFSDSVVTVPTYSDQHLFEAIPSPTSAARPPFDLESCASELEDRHHARGECGDTYFTQDDCSVRSRSPSPISHPVRVEEKTQSGRKARSRVGRPVRSPSPVADFSNNNDRKYRVEDLRAALHVLSDGTSTIGTAESAEEKQRTKKPTVRATAKTFGIPPETLRRFWKKVSEEQCHEKRTERIRVMKFPLLGNQRKRYFSEKDERELALSLVNAHGKNATTQVSEKVISAMACEAAKRRGVTNARCGKRWVSGFLRRNESIFNHWQESNRVSNDTVSAFELN